MLRSLLGPLATGPLTRGDFAAFISYSHHCDDRLGPKLKTGIERFARPWYRPRARRVFLDDSNLALNPDLWGSIEEALTQSGNLLLLASPPAARSPWVDKEVQWWLDHRSADSLLIVLTDGELASDAEAGGVDRSQTSALPPALAASIRSEPRWVDVRELRTAELDFDNPDWQSCLADIVAALDNKPKDALIGEHIQQGRRTRRLVGAVVTALTVLLIASLAGALVAVDQRNTAQEQTLLATSRQLVAEASAIRDTQPSLARQLLVQAYRLAPTDQVVGGLVDSASMPRVIPGAGSRAAAFSPRRGLAAIVSDVGVTLYDPVSAAPIATLDDSAGTTALAFSPDDQLLAVTVEGDSIRIFDVTVAEQPVLRTTLNTSDVRGTELAFAGTSSTVLVVRLGYSFGLWDIGDPAATRQLSVLPGSAGPMAVSRERQLLATRGDQDSIVLWDISDPSAPVVRATLTGHEGTVYELSFDPGGQWLASGGADNTARLWNVADLGSPSQRAVFSGQTLGIGALAFAPDGATLAIGAGDTSIHLWDIADPERPRQGSVLTGQTAAILDLAFSPDSRTLASVSADGAGGNDPNGAKNTVRLWNVIGATRSQALTGLPGNAPTVPTFTPDGLVLAAGRPTTLWSLDDPARPRPLSQVTTYSVGGQATAFSPDGRLLASGDPLVLWDTTDPAEPRNLTPNVVRTDRAVVVAFAPTAHVVVIGSPFQPLQLWTTGGETPRPAAALPGSVATAQSAAFAPKSGFLAARMQEGGVRLWDVSEPDRPVPLVTLPTDGEAVQSVAFGSDDLLVTGGTTGLVSLWDVHEPADPVLVSTVARHTGQVDGLAVQPGGSLLASAADDGTIRLSSISEPTRPIEVTVLQGGGLYDSPVLAFSPDGAVLAAARVQGAALWDVDVPSILRRLCAESSPIDETEWARYLPSIAYDPPCA